VGKFIFRDAIRVSIELKLVQRVPGQKYGLTPEGHDLASAADQSQPRERFLLRRALLDNADFVHLWRNILAHNGETSQRSLFEELSGRFGYTPSMAHTYANSALNFSKEAGLLTKGASPHGYIPNPDASRDVKGYVQQEISLGIYPLVDQAVDPSSDQRSVQLNPQPTGMRQTNRLDVRTASDLRVHSQAINEAYKLVARLGSLLVDKEQFESASERAKVSEWIESLPIFTGQGPDMEILRVAKEQVQAALRSKNVETLGFALRLLHVLAQRHEEPADR